MNLRIPGFSIERTQPIWIILIALLALVGVSHAAAQPPGFDLKYREDFESDPLEGWSLAPTCEVVSVDATQALRCTPDLDDESPLSNLALLEDYTLGDEPFRLRYRFRTEFGIFSTHLLLSQEGVDLEQYILVYLADQGVIDPILFRQMFGGDGEAVARDGVVKLDPSRWYLAEISFDGGTLVAEISLDGEVLLGLEFFDEELLPPRQLAFQASSGEVYIDDVEIWGPAEAPPPEQEAFPFSGEVFQGAPEDRSTPLEGVTVALYGANEPHPFEGEFLGDTQTGPEGFFELVGPAGYGYYAVRLQLPEGFDPLAATSPGGIVQDPDWIEFPSPREEVNRDGNAFFVQPPGQDFYDFSGRVFAGEPGDQSRPLEGLTVALAGANEPYPAEGEILAETQTGPDGEFNLGASAGYEYYSLRLFAPEEYEVLDAASPGGRVEAPDWIEYALPFGNRPLDGNEFYVFPPQPPEAGTPAWNFPACDPGESLLASFTFDDGYAPGWDLGEWQTAGGILITESPALASYEPGEWLDYHVRMGMKMAEDADGLILHLQAADGQGYKFLVQPRGVALSKEVDGEEIYSDSQGYPLEPLQWVELDAGVAGERMWVSIDNNLLLQGNDPETIEGGNLLLEAPGRGEVAVDVLWVCGEQAPLPPPPTEECFLGVFCGPLRWLVPLGGVLLLLVVTVGIGRLFFRGPGDPSQPGKLLPPDPGLPPIRLANAWLSQGAGGQGKPLRLDETLVTNSAYTLHVQIQPRQEQPRAGAVQNLRYPLDVVFFALNGDFMTTGSRRVRLDLPPDGASQEVLLDLQPQAVGKRRVRVGIYHQNVLLQSLVLDMQVAEKRRRQAGAIERSLDYVASSRFMDLDTLGSPILSLLTNQAADGDRWIGLFSSASGSPEWLQQGAVHKFSSTFLAARATNARGALSKVAGKSIYRLDYSLPMDADTLALRSADLIELAESGSDLFDALFLSILGAQDEEYLRNMSELLEKPGTTISVTRCRDDGTSFPWGALYTYYLEENEKLGLCPVFESWLAKQQTQPATDPGENLLDKPDVCHARADCPLATDAANRTVCPFGFWGFLHQIEQPLKLVEPVDVNTVPEELKDPKYEANSRIVQAPGEPVRMGMGAYAGFTDLSTHEANLKRLADPAVLDFVSTTDFDRIRSMLGEGGRHLLYFFCHGREVDQKFVLEFGDGAQVQYLGARGLDPRTIHWPPRPQPLIFINACESMALTPELVHGFLGKLSNLGASGVIGVEISNWSKFAAPFAEHLLNELLEGRTLGEATLQVRRDFLRQGNPLGLVYSLHGPASLHLHSEAGCPYCANRELKRQAAIGTD
jgi:hypothetical protein